MDKRVQWILREANRIADRVAVGIRTHRCAYHHASDLLHSRAGLRQTTRCKRSYTPNPTEQAVEAFIEWNRLEEGIS